MFPLPARHSGEAPYANFEPPFTSGRSESRPYTAINMVASLDGRVSEGGKSGGIGGEVDRASMRDLRASADAVIIGAGTLRAEKMSLGVPWDLADRRESSGKARQPLCVIIGGSKNLPLKENLIGYDPQNTIIFLPQYATNEARAEAEELGSVELLTPFEPAADNEDDAVPDLGVPDLGSALDFLFRERGVRFALAEGGPSLNLMLLSQELVDDLFLTLSPRLIGGASQTIVADKNFLPQNIPAGVRIVSVFLAQCSGELFLRYSLR